MKYVWILVAVVILVRIDLVLKFFDKTAKQIDTQSAPDIQPSDVTPGSDLIPMASDPAIKSNPRQIFISMLNNFQAAPDSATKLETLEYLRAHPTLFSEKLDTELESAVYQMRNLIVQRDKETPQLLLEMMKMLKGENLEMIRRFFSFVIDVDMVEFLSLYSKSPDLNCMIIKYLGDPLPVEERFNELSERLVALENYLNSEKVSPVLKPYGDKCHMVLRLEVEKMKLSFQPQTSEETPPPEAAPQEAPVATDPGNVP